MKLADLPLDDARLDPRSAAIEIAGVTADSRKVKPGFLFVAIAGAKADGAHFARAAARRRRGGGGGGAASRRAARRASPSSRSSNARRALALAAATFFPRQPATIAAVTGTSGKTSVAAFTRQIWAALGLQAASIGTVGVVSPQGRNLRLAHHARSGRAAPHARPTGGRGRHASGAGGLLARPRPAPARRRAHRRRRLHQSVARSSRLSSDHRGLSRRQAAAVRRT